MILNEYIILLSNLSVIVRLYGLLCFWICGVENVSAYIFHDEFFFSFKRVLVQGRRPCFRRLYRRLCFVKCKRLHFTRFCVSLDKFWVHRGQNRTEFGQTEGRIGQLDKRLDKWTKLDKLDKRTSNPWYSWVSDYSVRCFCPDWTKWTSSWTKNLETLDMTGFTLGFVQQFVHSWTNEINSEKGLTAGFVRVFSWVLSICPEFSNFSLKFF